MKSKKKKTKQNKNKKQKKKKKKKKRSSPFFITFPSSISNFPPSLLQFSFFSSQFSPLFLFFLASFFPDTSAKTSRSEVSGGGHSARLLRYCQDVVLVVLKVPAQFPVITQWKKSSSSFHEVIVWHTGRVLTCGAVGPRFNSRQG